MSARAAAERIPVSGRIWHCESNFIFCEQGDHLLTFHETGYRADLRRLTGHAFLSCRECNPPSFFLAVFVKDPSPMATCYALSRESYEQWDKSPEPTPSTPELLYLIRDPEGKSFNPYFRPQRSHR